MIRWCWRWVTAVALVAAGCGDDSESVGAEGSSSGAGGDGSPTDTTDPDAGEEDEGSGGTGAGDDALAFPVGLAVASPFRAASSAAAARADGVSFGVAAGWVSDHQWLSEQVQSVLEGTVPVRDAVEVPRFFQLGGQANCFGPSLAYVDHPDGAVPNEGMLPGGDLGLWSEAEEDGEACAAAQLNARLDGVRLQAQSSMLIAAGLASAATQSGLTAPQVGGEPLDLTEAIAEAGLEDTEVGSATISQPSSGVWRYAVALETVYLGAAREIEVELSHTPGSESYAYSGTITWRIGGDAMTFPGGNCQDSSRTRVGSLLYERTSETELALQARAATFCGAGSGSFDGSGQVDPADTYSMAANPTGWSENFSTLVADFDPTTVAGQYSYMWQAGHFDSNTRVFNIGINDNDPLDGEAYFGYGAPMPDCDGSIVGFICNWAGPGSQLVVHERAQRQALRFDETTGTMVQPEGGSDILYAPTNDCTYDGSGTFWYDRNVNMTDDESEAELTVTTADLLTAGDGQTVAEAIAGRGFDPPVALGGWPGG